MRVWDLNPCTLILDRLKEKDVVSHTRLHFFSEHPTTCTF